jgi:hypothetical protein
VKFLVAGLPAALAVLGIVPVMVLVAIWRYRNQRYRRKSPLTQDLLRAPGHSLRLKIEDLNCEIVLCLLAIMMVPLYIFAFHIYGADFFRGMRMCEDGLRSIRSLALSAKGKSASCVCGLSG